jgi:GNAT superfamily N-acetyltransferase
LTIAINPKRTMTEPDATAPCAAAHDLSRLVERWTSRDGATLLIRPIVGDDEGLERAFLDGLSRDTSYRRLLSGRTPQADEIARWTHIDYRKEMALVAIDDRDATVRMCGVARYVCEGDGRAAFAIVIADDWQGRGLGRKLMEALIAAARTAGVVALSDIMLSDNVAMRSLVQRLGFTIGHEPGDATLRRITLDLTAP